MTTKNDTFIKVHYLHGKRRFVACELTLLTTGEVFTGLSRVAPGDKWSCEVGEALAFADALTSMANKLNRRAHGAERHNTNVVTRRRAAARAAAEAPHKAPAKKAAPTKKAATKKAVAKRAPRKRAVEPVGDLLDA